MLTKNLTPFLFGAKVTSLRPPGRDMVAIVRASFKMKPGAPLVAIEDLLEQGAMTGDLFHEADEERAGELTYASDFADFKMRADVLLRGTCHPPGGRPARECTVRFAVGAWSKALKVTGRRAWTEQLVGAKATDAVPFAKMPLGYAESFGGPDDPRNPIGKGGRTAELPCIEHPATPVRSRRDRPEPAGFGPLNPAWAQRAGKVGREYGKSYREKRAPFYAEDFDWTYFNAAPLDQQLPYLRGDEDLVFENLHETAPFFVSKLPAIRICVFVKDVAATFREVQMNLDTLHADLDKELLTLTWRGVLPVREDDLKDVSTVLIAQERLDSQKLPEPHYRKLLEEFEADPQEIEKHMPGARAKLAALRAIDDERKANPTRDPTDRVLSILEADNLGLIKPEQRAGIQQAIAKMREGIAKAPPAPPSVSASAPDPAAALRGLMERVKELQKLGAARGLARKGTEDFETLMADPRARQASPLLGAVFPEAPRKLADATDATAPRAPRVPRAKPAPAANDFVYEGTALPDTPNAPGFDAPPPQPKAPPGFAPPRPAVADAGPGMDLSGMDFSKKDLAGRDLSDCNLEGANFTATNLRGANLAGSSLKRCAFRGADLSGADLSECDLSQAFVTKAIAPGVILEGATLTQTFLSETNLRGARLAGAKGEMTILSGADLSDADLSGVTLTKAFADAPVLERANFAGADLAMCTFTRANGRGASFTGAKLSKTSFADSDLTGASFFDATGEGVVFMRATLGDADFRYAALRRSHFLEASAKLTRFFGADLRGANFYRATLDSAGFVKANLSGANLSKASLQETQFVGASLYDAKLLNVRGSNWDTTAANLKRSTLQGE